MIHYTPFGHSDWQTDVSDIETFGSAGKKTAVVSTINGDANVPFYKELGNQGIKAKDIPVVAFSVGEEELAGLDTKPLSTISPPGTTSSRSRRRPTRSSSRMEAYTKNPKRTTNDPMEADVIGFAMWIKAVEKAEPPTPTRSSMRCRYRRPEPHGRHLDHAAEPSHHQAGVRRRGPGHRRVRRGVEEQGSGPGRRRSDFLPGSKDLESRLGQAPSAATTTPSPRSAAVRAPDPDLTLHSTIGEGGDPAAFSTILPGSFTVPANLSARLCSLLLSLFLIAFALPAFAGPFEDAVAKFANDDYSDTEEAIGVVASSGNPLAFPIISALQDGRLMADPDSKKVYVTGADGKSIDAATGAAGGQRSRQRERGPPQQPPAPQRRCRDRQPDAAVAGSRSAAPGRAIRLQVARGDRARGGRRRARQGNQQIGQELRWATPAPPSCCSSLTPPRSRSSRPSPPSRRAATRRRWRCSPAWATSRPR